MSKDLRNLFISIALSTLVLVAWQYFYESPRKAEFEKKQAIIKQTKVENQLNIAKKTLDADSHNKVEWAGEIVINTDKISGKIDLRGLRFNNLNLKGYKETLDSNSPLVQLFSREYFAEFGWIKNLDNENFSVPSKSTIWQCDSLELTKTLPVHCYWKDNSGVHYFVQISVDDNYLFTISQTVENKTSNNISLAIYGRIFKAKSEPKQFAILHEGAIGVFSDVLKESTYEDLDKNKQEFFTNTNGSWAGFTNKYWLAALVPDRNLASKTQFISSNMQNEQQTSLNNYNVNFISQDVEISPDSQIKTTNLLFAGAKEEQLLDHYSKEHNIALFDRAIDYGIFYFITKPLLWLINYFYSLMGNFGLAILLVTLTLKLLMYPLANKSYLSMNKMKELQPRIEQIKTSCGEDKVKFNQEIMKLYKIEKVNPAAGCLPILIQIPLFFSLYKVIFISIGMRHAPFYGWIKDLSAADPTSIWNLFGLLPWGNLGTLDIGVWPLIMGVTMFLQQKMSPAPQDPVQASVMKFMPLVLMAMLCSLPSGLMIYWSFSNVLSILQQYVISKNSKK